MDANVSPSGPSGPGPDPSRRALPGADRLTTTERMRLAVFRLRGRLLCRVGRHAWARRHNPDVGGAQAVYHLCRRCGTEYSPPDSTQVWM
ncbi:MAG: hypothetical protein ACKVZ6_08010 [Kineosporiaceae bacterium]